MFNSELKERFLADYIDNTARLYRYVLSKAESMESQLNKDVSLFNATERDMLLYSYSNRSRGTIDSIRTALSKYVAFCIDEGLVDDAINYFTAIGGSDLDRYVDKSAMENKYIGLDDIIDMTKYCINLQDLLPIYLAFSGVLGEAASEIINLKKYNLIDGKIKLENREIEIESQIYAEIKKALDEDTYYLNNGESSSFSDSRKINKTEWVVRPVGETKSGKLIYSSLLQRVKRVKQYYGNPYLTLKNMWFSGMIHDLSQAKDTSGEVTNEDWNEVIHKFNYSGETSQLKHKLKDFI